MSSNYDHLQNASPRRMAAVILELGGINRCIYCPMGMEQSCRDDCVAGLTKWLKSPYVRDSDLWKEKPNEKQK